MYATPVVLSPNGLRIRCRRGECWVIPYWETDGRRGGNKPNAIREAHGPIPPGVGVDGLRSALAIRRDPRQVTVDLSCNERYRLASRTLNIQRVLLFMREGRNNFGPGQVALRAGYQLRKNGLHVSPAEILRANHDTRRLPI